MSRRARIVLLILALMLAGAAGAYRLMNARTYQLFGEIIARGETDERVIALTFDDGPQPEATDRILTILDELDVPATFFVTGADLERHMDAARRIVAAGHALGNHSYSHRRMVLVSPSFVHDEIERTDALIREADYTGEIYFRPPYSKKLVVLPWYLARTGRTTVMVDIEPESYAEIAGDAATLAAHVEERARPGSIILLHVMYGGREASTAAVPEIVTRLRAQGYRFVTVPNLIALAR